MTQSESDFLLLQEAKMEQRRSVVSDERRSGGEKAPSGCHAIYGSGH